MVEFSSASPIGGEDIASVMELTPAVDEADATAPEVSFIRGDGSAAVLSTAWIAAKQGNLKNHSRKLRRFYKHQNTMIEIMMSDLEDVAPDNAFNVATVDSSDRSAFVLAAVNGSFFLNVCLTVAKIVAVVASGSMSALASAADSLLDLVSGAVLFLTQRAMRRADPYKYPEGKARLEPLGVVIFAVVMGMSSLQIILEAVRRLIDIVTKGPTLKLDVATLTILLSTILLKVLAMLLCRWVAARQASPSVDAYAQDHRNDVLTNSVGVVAILLAAWQPDQLDTLDPIGAIVIALWIIASWMTTAMEQINKLTGLVAPPDFVSRLTNIVFCHDARVQKVDTCRAYHFGERFLVEVEVVMRPDTPLRESHDVGIMLQHKIERLDEVERAFVHIDYTVRDVDDHDPRTPIVRKTAAAPQWRQQGHSPPAGERESLMAA